MQSIRFFKHAVEWLFFGVLIFALLVIFYSSNAAQGVRGVVFPEAKNEVVFSDSVKIGERDTYILELAQGQNCEVEIVWQGADTSDEGQGLSVFTIIYPKGEKYEGAQDGYIQAGQAGDYQIVVSPKTRKTSDRYSIIFKHI